MEELPSTGPAWSYLPSRLGLSYLMLMRPLRLTARILSSLVLCSQIPIQAQAPSPSQAAPTTMRPDPKRAQKAAERGDKAAAAGRFEEALTAYEEAAHCAPQDAAIVERGAALRSRQRRVRLWRHPAGRNARPLRRRSAPPRNGPRLRPCRLARQLFALVWDRGAWWWAQPATERELAPGWESVSKVRATRGCGR